MPDVTDIYVGHKFYKNLKEVNYAESNAVPAYGGEN